MSSLPAALRPQTPPASKPEDSDEDLFTVPDVESGPGSSSPAAAAAAEARKGGEGPSKPRKGRNPADREYRRIKRPFKDFQGRKELTKMKDYSYRSTLAIPDSATSFVNTYTRLLRNRVSAQQARERKKVYLNDLESTAKELHEQNMKLEEKISTLINENTMLRKVLMNARPKSDESVEHNEKTGKL